MSSLPRVKYIALLAKLIVIHFGGEKRQSSTVKGKRFSFFEAVCFAVSAGERIRKVTF
jgi:hypothetical protein